MSRLEVKKTYKLYINPGTGVFSAVTPYTIGAEADDTRDVVVEFFSPEQAPRIITANAGQTNKMYTVPCASGLCPAGAFDTPLSAVTPMGIGTDADDTRSIIVADAGDVGTAADGLIDVIATNTRSVKTYLNPGDNDFSAVESDMQGGGGLNSAYSLALPSLPEMGDQTSL